MVKSRIVPLDFAKAFAIILVVLGHYIQMSEQNFDKNLAFKMIYSFHMPLFIMLSGIAAQTWLNPMEKSSSLKCLTATVSKRIVKSTITLYLPFMSWAVFGHVVKAERMPILKYLFSVIKYPDQGLWFLPCLLWCIVYITSAKFCFALIYKLHPSLRMSLGNRAYLFEFLIILSIWSKAKILLPRNYGFAFANYFHEGLFVYFVIGIYVGSFLEKLARRKCILLIATTTYFTLSPFWSRLEQYSLSKNCPHMFKNRIFSGYFSFLVATAGSLAIIFICFEIARIKAQSLEKIVTVIAGSTLGIYALHEYFLQRPVDIVNSIVLSLFWVRVINGIPYLDTLMLGKYRYVRKGD